jgi:hypothetical protein
MSFGATRRNLALQHSTVQHLGRIPIDHNAHHIILRLVLGAARSLIYVCVNGLASNFSVQDSKANTYG